MEVSQASISYCVSVGNKELASIYVTFKDNQGNVLPEVLVTIDNKGGISPPKYQAYYDDIYSHQKLALLTRYNFSVK